MPPIALMVIMINDQPKHTPINVINVCLTQSAALPHQKCSTQPNPITAVHKPVLNSDCAIISPLCKEWWGMNKAPTVTLSSVNTTIRKQGLPTTWFNQAHHNPAS